MLLSILIPTYNRSQFLLKNLKELSSYILFLEKTSEIEIVISNNCSPDDTDIVVQDFINENDLIKFKYYTQEKNIGLQANALFVLEKSNTEYVMYLGDDDFIEKKYLQTVIEYIDVKKEIFSIIPSFYPINLEGVKSGLGRDIGLSRRTFEKGIENCYINSFRGHQLSGLVLKRENLLNSYIQNKVNNIYLFIYFVSFSCLKGKTLHLPEFPVRVTAPGQDAKDWNYGVDGLLSEVFDNYFNLPVNSYQKTKLQIRFFNKQFWRLWAYKNKGIKFFLKAFFKIWSSSKTTFLFKIIFPFLVIKIQIVNLYKKLFS